MQQLLPTQRLSWQGVYCYSTNGASKELRNSFGYDYCNMAAPWTCPAFNSMAAIHRLKTAEPLSAIRAVKRPLPLTPFLAANTVQSLAMATPQVGNHQDTFGLEQVFAELCDLLEQAQLRLAGQTKPSMLKACVRTAPSAR